MAPFFCNRHFKIPDISPVIHRPCSNHMESRNYTAKHVFFFFSRCDRNTRCTTRWCPRAKEFRLEGTHRVLAALECSADRQGGASSLTSVFLDFFAKISLCELERNLLVRKRRGLVRCREEGNSWKCFESHAQRIKCCAYRTSGVQEWFY